jgi:SAM-dependent methyltransferase
VSWTRSGASFRDPSGFVFVRDDIVYRQVQASYGAEYDQLLESGLYEELASRRLLVPHREAPLDAAAADGAYRILEPEPVPFISYPYEWCFSQLRDAALLTLDIQGRALARGMTLKDASAFNVQFVEGRPIFVDTLSFERYHEGQPWVAYRQFCQHFLAPLLLMSRVDVRLGRLSSLHVDGVPLDLASALLPRRTWLRPAWLTHVHLHAYSIARYAGRKVPKAVASRGVSRRGLEGLIRHLEGAIETLSWHERTEWSEYGADHGYTEGELAAKHEAVSAMIRRVEPGSAWDLGANTGTYSRLAASLGARVIAVDADAGAVERHYADVRSGASHDVLPLCIDLTNPSPRLGWAHEERKSLEDRGPADLVLALALVHHLAISGNVPLPLIADWMARLGRAAIVEFVPKDDPQTRRLLQTRRDVFHDYERDRFEAAFGRRFRIVQRVELTSAGRAVYLMDGNASERDG